jgi:peroxiredoxin
MMFAMREGEQNSAPEVGQAAPAFRLNDHLGKVVALGGKRSTWSVLAFFPKAATPG